MRRRERVLWVAVLAALSCSEPTPDYHFFDACHPRRIPDTACYAAKRDPSSGEVALATRIALRYIDEHPPQAQRWSWEVGVLMYAMTELYRVTADQRIGAYFAAWMDHHLAKGYAIAISDACPPALTAIALYAQTGREDYADVAREVLRYLREDSLRTDEGGISHLGIVEPKTLWVDSLFMFGMVLVRWGEQAHDEKALAEMGTQLAIFADLLQSESGLFVHAYGWPAEHDDDVYWARGNSWVTIAAADYLRARLLGHEADDRVAGILDRQIAGVLAAQDKTSGSFFTILNRPGETYLETSATALFAYGLSRAYRYGLAEDDVLLPISRAMTALANQIGVDDRGRPYVTGISGPTGVGTFEDYAAVPLENDLSYGVGGAILALVEASGLPRSPP
jgi:unsaturated rhamnogalacturonyl hydrolase